MSLLWFHSMYYSFQSPLVILGALGRGRSARELFLPISDLLSAFALLPFASCLREGQSLASSLVQWGSAPAARACLSLPHAGLRLSSDFRSVGCPVTSACWWVQERSWTCCLSGLFPCKFRMMFFPALWINSVSGSSSLRHCLTLEVEHSVFPNFPNSFSGSWHQYM